MSLVDVIPLVFRDACYIAANIRKQDWDECRCQIHEEEKIVLAQLCFFGTEDGLKWCARYRGNPVAAFGAIASGPSLYNLWMWATPRVMKVFPRLVKFLDVELRDELIRRGARRLELRAYEEHEFVKRGWLEKAGAIPAKDPLLQYGKNGETFRLYAWWKGMPDGKDVRNGYTPVRSSSVTSAVCDESEGKQLRSGVFHDSLGGGSVSVHALPDSDDRSGRDHNSERGAVELHSDVYKHNVSNHSVLP